MELARFATDYTALLYATLFGHQKHIMETQTINTLTLIFDGEIADKEVPLFRGAVLASMRGQADILYHNHQGEDGYRYAYPLIQYKRVNGRAAMVCINEGAEQIGHFLVGGAREYRIGNRQVTMSPSTLFPASHVTQTWTEERAYTILRWLPLNPENYKRYQAATSMIERIALLEGILKANILSMAKGLGIHVTEVIKVTLTAISAPYQLKNKGVSLMAFDAEFTTNFNLPDYIGLGKNASIGYGVVTRNEKK